MPLPQPQTSGMRKILLFIEHDVGKACMDFIAFVIELFEEHFHFLIHRKRFIGRYCCCCYDGVIWRGCLGDSIVLLGTESRDMSLLIALEAFSLFNAFGFFFFHHSSSCSGSTEIHGVWVLSSGKSVGPLFVCSSHHFVPFELIAELNVFLVLLAGGIGPGSPIVWVVKFDAIPDQVIWKSILE